MAFPPCIMFSPSVWRGGPGGAQDLPVRLNLMLTLLPFEATFYEQQGVPVRYVGHPLADEIPLSSDVGAAGGRWVWRCCWNPRHCAAARQSDGGSQPVGTAVSGNCPLAAGPTP